MKITRTGHKIEFGTLQQDGTVTNVRYIKQSDIARCPFLIWIADHYREDGSCKCDDVLYRRKVMRLWGYKRADFVKAGVIKP